MEVVTTSGNVRNQPVEAVVFDLGGVLIDWDPRYLYRKLFGGDDAAMETFLATICTSEWNERFDRGESFPEGVRALAAAHPQYADLIHAYWERWPEMVAGEIGGTVEILAGLRNRGVPLFALSNWSTETFVRVRHQFPFLDWFHGMVISGEVGLVKPDSRIYELLRDRHSLVPERTLFVDDKARNVEAARNVGFQAIQFTSPGALRAYLEEMGL